MTIPDAAIEAAAEGLYTEFMLDQPDDYQWPWSKIGDSQEYWREQARTAIEAAMPAIREAIAQEIEKIADNTDRRMIDDANGNWWAYEPLRLREWIDAARIVRGGAA